MSDKKFTKIEAIDLATGETVEIKVSAEDWLEIETIAQRVGGDFGMKVKLGKPGGGSFFDTHDCSITFDPLHVKEDAQGAKFIAGHEGSHRAITPSAEKLGLTKKEVSALYSNTGFGYIQNIIEDTTVNSWLRKRFPGFEEPVKEFYDDQFEGVDKSGGTIGTPESARAAAMLGYEPKFAQFGTEIMRDWHHGKFSDDLDPFVRRALKRTIDSARKSASDFPDPEKMDKKEILKSAGERFRRNTEEVWPEVKKLVEMDLHTEEIRQMMNEMMKKDQARNEKQEELEDAEQKGDKGRAEQLKKEIDQLNKELESYDKMKEEFKKELQDKMNEALKGAIDKMNEHIDEQQKKIDENKKKQEELDKEIKDLESKADGASGEEKEKLEKELEQKKAEKQEAGLKEQKAKQELDKIKEELDEAQDPEGSMPFPADAISPEVMAELEKMLNKLPQQQYDENKKKAEDVLQGVEDKLNEELAGKLVEQPKNHEEQKKEAEKERAEKEIERKREQERKRIESEIERQMRESMSDYEKARAEVAGQIDDLFFRLRRILKPEEYGKEETGFPSGQMLDITRAMQAEHDFDQKSRLFIRETTPGKKDYRFWHLVDLSGSMMGQKIEETFRGFIIAGEAIDRLENSNTDMVTVRQGITGFHNRVFDFKNMNERYSDKTEKVLSTMPERTRDYDSGTDTYSGTVRALEGLKRGFGETGNFLLTFTDGSPNYDSAEKLRTLLRDTKSERQKMNIKVGLIWLGEPGADDATLKTLVDKFGYDFGLVMPVVKAIDFGTGEKKKDFSEALGDLLEALVKNPEMY